MTNAESTIYELTGLGYARALHAKKWLRLVKTRLEELFPGDTETQDVSENTAADAVLRQIVRQATPPAILLSYLSLALETGLFSARILSIQLLFWIRSQTELPLALLSTVSRILLLNPTGLERGNLLPAFLLPYKSATPVEGSPDGSAGSTSTLLLLLPLLRSCASDPSLADISNLTGRILSLLAPYPAPPFDVGFQAGQLLSSLPDGLASPLRDCLSGLMADLTISQNQPQIYPSVAKDASASGPTSISHSLPLLPTITFLLEHLHRCSDWEVSRPDSSNPPTHHLRLVRLGSQICSDPSSFLLHLLQAAMEALLRTPMGTQEGVIRWLFLIEGLPSLMDWWKQNPENGWIYPSDISTIIAAVYGSMGESLVAFSDQLSGVYSALVIGADSEEESEGFIVPEGWKMYSVQETFLLRLVETNLLISEEATTVSGSALTGLPDARDSLLDRLSSTPSRQLSPLVHVTVYAFGAARSLANEISTCIRSCSSTPAPENVFANLSREPTLLAALSTFIRPNPLLDLLVSHVVDVPSDPVARENDPQGSLTRFGEGLILVEAVASQFKLPLPKQIQRSRFALPLRNLTASQQSLVNGWVVALFGPHGIEDEILLATSPHDFLDLAASLIHQSISAAIAGQIDQETLRGGLSYFSQPLLSWCLGGVVHWLCSEIQRLGLLAAVHLDVLQTLVLSDQFPEPLLRVCGSAIHQIFSPSAGLAAVLQTSDFDVLAVQSKLSAIAGDLATGKSPYLVKANRSSDLPEHVRLDVCEMLRVEMEALQQFNFASDNWSITLLDTLGVAVDQIGPEKTIDIIAKPICLQPTGTSDSAIHFTSLLVNLRLSRRRRTPLIVSLIDSFLPSCFLAVPRQQLVYNPQATAQFLSLSLKVADNIHLKAEGDLVSFADSTASHLEQELRYLRLMPVISSSRATKRARIGSKGSKNPLSQEQKTFLDRLGEAISKDDLVTGRWSGFAL
ncbi:mediator of RNA polymerase II transcription subunit 5, partial [Tremellales sp. Uapishka_1]